MAKKKHRSQGLPTAYLVLAALAAVAVFPTALRPPADEATTSAEFSPDAPPEDQPEAIIQSLEQAASRTAGATGQSEPAGSTTTTTQPPPPPPEQAAVRNRCFGDPPRQIEAIYSAPCEPAFVGDNGGATAPGVTANEIRIGIAPQLSGTMSGSNCGEIGGPRPGEGDAYRTYRVLRDYFNQNLELYGRELRFFYACADPGTQGEEGARSQAVRMIQEYDVFAGITEFDSVIPTELAKARRASMSNIVVAGDTYFRNRAPYVWGSRAHSTRAVDMGSEYLCRRLQGNTPFATGDALIDYESPRRFGILALADAVTQESVDLMEQQMMAKCGAEAVVRAEYNLDDNVQGIGSAMLRLSSHQPRISTIVFMGEILTLPVHAELANQQNFFPEWYTMGAGGFETSILLARTISPRQWQNSFGFSFEEIPRRPRSTSCYRAYRSIDPENDPNSSVCQILWHSMLFTFGAIQEAGPTLTQEEWSRSLARAFTRPPEPEWSMSGGFSETDYTYGDYAVELYWDPTAVHPDGQPGAYVYLNNGIRFLADGIPSGQPPMFQGGITDGDNAGPDGNAFN